MSFFKFLGARVYVTKTTHVNLLTDPQRERPTLRPIDVPIYEWGEVKHACVDLIGVSPLVGSRTVDFTLKHITLKVVSSKVTKLQSGKAASS
jgi:hypothetical protein